MVSSFGSKVSDQAGKLEGLPHTVESQNQELGRIRSDVESSVTSAVSKLQHDMTAQLSAQLAGQTAQISALFAEKKPAPPD